MNDYIPTATEKTRDRAIKFLRTRLEELGQRIDAEAVNKDDFAELFKSCYLSIVRSHRDEKLKAATGILANFLLREGDTDKLSYTELDHYARCVETLSSGAVEVLGMVVRIAHSGSRLFEESKLDWTINSYEMNFGDLRTRFPQYSPELLMGLVAELDRANLLHRGVPGIRESDYANYTVELTPLGQRFARFLID